MKNRFENWGIDHFSPEEIITLRNPRWDKSRQMMPPPEMRDNIKNTIMLADALRKAWGDPIIVWSGYRPPEYNKLVGGAPRSQHKVFKALDLHPANGKVKEFQKVADALVRGARVAGMNVGFGKYDKFIHIDTNADTGHNRTWTG